MKELSHYQKRVLDKIYGPLKKTDPLQELKRLCRIHLDFLHNEKDRYLRSEFKKVVEAKLIFHLNSDKRFQDYDSFKENYLLETKNYINKIQDELGGWHKLSKVIMVTNAYTNNANAKPNHAPDLCDFGQSKHLEVHVTLTLTLTQH